MSGTIYTYVYILWRRFERRPLDEVCEPLWSTPGKCCTAILDISEFYAWRGSSYWQILVPWWSSRGIFCRRPPSNRWNDHRPPKITFKRSETSRALRTCLGTLHAFKPLQAFELWLICEDGLRCAKIWKMVSEDNTLNFSGWSLSHVSIPSLPDQR